jgi:DNA polymerase-3 subunit gamma/tau
MTEASGERGNLDGRVLYLRWRPRTFSDVVGQEAVVRTLRNAVARGTPGHAYLLCGPRGTGKTSLARILFKALNCDQPRDGDPCGVCASCLASDRGRALDLVEIDAASNRGIDDIRALRERARFAPTDARFKVYIVDEAHQLTQPAWDAFLKTLEEPPPSTVFVLATTAVHRVPATIVSRCQRFDLTRIPQPRIVAHLEQVARDEGIGLEPGVAERVARLARGGMRDALSMLEQLAAFGDTGVSLETARQVLGLVRGDALQAFVDALLRRDSQRALILLEDMSREGADLRQFVDELLFYLRGVLLTRVGAETAIAGDFGGEELDWIRSSAQQCSPAEISEILRLFGDVAAVGSDERRLVIRLELATVSATRLRAASDALVAASSPAPAFERTPVHGIGEAAMRAATAEPQPASDEHPLLESQPALARRGDPDPAGSAPAHSPAADSDRSGSGSGVVPRSDESAPSVGLAESPDLGVDEGAATAPSLAAIQARWPLLRESFQGPLSVQLLLDQTLPIRLINDEVTIAGPFDQIDLGRLQSQYHQDIRAFEDLVSRDLGLPVHFRFVATDGELGEESTADGGEMPIPEFARSLFGGELVPLGEVGEALASGGPDLQ